MANRIIIGNDKGGVGKTTATDFIISAFNDAGFKLAVGEMDREHKLSTMFEALGDKLDLAVSPPDTDQLVNDSDELMRYYTPALSFLAGHEYAILDCGANISSLLIRAAEMLSISEDIDPKTITVVSCTTNDGQSIAGAKHMLKTAPQAFPGCRRILIANEKDGTVDLDAFTGLCDGAITIDRAKTRLMKELASNKLIRFERIERLDAAAVMKALGEKDLFNAKAGLMEYRRWYRSVIDQIKLAFELNQAAAIAV